MARLPLNSFLSISRRSYAVAAENAGVSPASAVMKKISDSGSRVMEAQAEPKVAFWMKDPKTGYWIPENHFDEVDVSTLREKLLSKKT